MVLSNSYFTENIAQNSLIISDDFHIDPGQISDFRQLINWGLRHKNWTLILSMHSFFRTSIHNELSLANHFILIKSRVGDIFHKKHKNESFISDGYTSLRSREYLYVNLKNQYSVVCCLVSKELGYILPLKMYSNDVCYTIHDNTAECQAGGKIDSPDSPESEIPEGLIDELNGLYPKHHRKVYFVIKNLTINNLLFNYYIELKYKKQSSTLHLYDFLSIILNPCTLSSAKKPLTKREKIFFKLLFLCSQKYPWPNYLFPKHLQKLNVR